MTTSGDGESGTDRTHDGAHVRRNFGYTWGETGGTLWLRNDNGDYKRIDPAFREPLRALARGEREPSAADPAVLEAIDVLADEGYLEPSGERRRLEMSADIRLWPRLVATGAVTIVLCALIVAQWETIWSPPGSVGKTVVLAPFFVGATLLHELGHYVAGRPYFEPSISIGRLNGVIPAVITRTGDAWQCPRNVRIWISLAGPVVDIVVTLELAIALLQFPGYSVLGSCILVQLFRLLFVLNPLVDGDGYWLFVDVFGTHNLRNHAFRDLKRGRPTPKAAFALTIVVFTGWFVAASGYFLGHTLGIL
ncbi:hypothetical protein [Natrinema caseinilyticum]|uniref:hypothetical protein n=1 Tax=Natrinema caseinilyticum TaxID=2961570 RepID=UPI0020C1B9B6|nr:hypothetical protein [Natrinema caseinilyticum]